MAPYLNFKNKKHYNLSVFGIYFHIYYFAEKRERRSLSSYLHKTNFSFDVTCKKGFDGMLCFFFLFKKWCSDDTKTVWERVYVSLTVYVKNIASNTLGICVFCSLVTMKFPILIPQKTFLYRATLLRLIYCTILTLKIHRHWKFVAATESIMKHFLFKSCSLEKNLI